MNKTKSILIALIATMMVIATPLAACGSSDADPDQQSVYVNFDLGDDGKQNFTDLNKMLGSDETVGSLCRTLSMIGLDGPLSVINSSSSPNSYKYENNYPMSGFIEQGNGSYFLEYTGEYYVFDENSLTFTAYYNPECTYFAENGTYYCDENNICHIFTKQYDSDSGSDVSIDTGSIRIYGDHIRLGIKYNEGEDQNYDLTAAADLDFTIEYDAVVEKAVNGLCMINESGNSEIYRFLSVTNKDALNGYSDFSLNKGDVISTKATFNCAFKVNVNSELERTSTDNDGRQMTKASFEFNGSVALDSVSKGITDSNSKTFSNTYRLNLAFEIENGITESYKNGNYDSHNVTTVNKLDIKLYYSVGYNGNTMSTTVQPSNVISLILGVNLNSGGKTNSTTSITPSDSDNEIMETLKDVSEISGSDSDNIEVTNNSSDVDRMISEVNGELAHKTPAVLYAVAGILAAIGLALIAYTMVVKRS